MHKAILYILIFKEKHYIKLGTTTDINRRLKEIERDWGEVDRQSSYWFEESVKRASQIEHHLKCCLVDYRVKVTKNPGWTEFFSSESLYPARHIIENHYNYKFQQDLTTYSNPN